MEQFNYLDLYKSISRGDLTFKDLRQIGFNPYFPYELNPPSKLSQDGIHDVEAISQLFTPHDCVYSVRIVGSASVGLAKAFPFGVHKTRLERSFFLKRDYKDESDIDVEILIDWGYLDYIKNLVVGFDFQRRTQNGRINLAFYPYDEVIAQLRSSPYSSALQRYGAWSNRHIVFKGDEILDNLRNLSENTVKNSSLEAQKWFWQNLADRYLFHQARLLIKRGEFEEITLTQDEVPTLFDPRFRNQPRTKSVIKI